jgi:hypothetical protein
VAGADRAAEPPGQRRWEFVRAFVENSWARPGSARPTARPHIVLLVAALSAGAALATGVILQQFRPVKPAGTAGSAPPGSGPSARYSAVAGWDCSPTGDHGFTASGRQPTWRTIGQGGWAQDGCSGAFEVIPPSDNEKACDRGPNAVWWFAPTGGMRTCTVLTYVPAPVPGSYTPLTAERFVVVAGRGGGSAFAEFVVDQSARPEQWMVAGTYPVGRQGIAVQLGNPAAPAPADAGLAVAQIKLECAA